MITTVAFDADETLVATGAAVKLALECAGATPDQFVYVGDDYENDVVRPKAAGMRGVWVNPEGLPVPGETRPDAVIENLAELPRILAGWR